MAAYKDSDTTKTSLYFKFNLIIYRRLRDDINILRNQFNTLNETKEFIKEFIKKNEIDMFEIQ